MLSVVAIGWALAVSLALSGSAGAAPGALTTPASDACSVSGATGAGAPTPTINVGPPVGGGGDSSTEIQSAIDSANGPATVVLQAGTYYISNPITVKSGVDFRGAGEASTTVQATTALGTGSVVQTSGHSNITIEQMTLNQDGSAQSSQSLTHYLLDLDGAGTAAGNVIVQNVATRNPATYAISAHNGISGFCIRDNNVQDTNTSNTLVHLDGIHATHAVNGDIVNNYVDNMAGGATGGDDGIAIQAEGCGATCWDTGNSSNIAVQGNVVRGGVNGSDFNFAISGGYTISGVTMTDNEFWGAPDGVLAENFGGGGTLSNVTMTNNISHNNSSPGYELPCTDDAILCSGITQTNITISGWYWCSDSGPPAPSSGTSNGVTASGVVQYSSCTDNASTSSPPPSYPPPTISTSPQGNWVGAYGGSGYDLAAFNGSSDAAVIPGGSVSLAQGSRYRWASGTSDVRALQSPDQGTRNAATYYDPSQLQVQLTLGTAYTGSLELYAVDWDSTARRETITVNGQSATLGSDFSQGAWVTFQLSGATTVTITVTRNAGANAVLSGIFLGTGNPPSYPSAPQGNWVGAYGGSGYDLAAFNGSSDAALIPGGSVSLAQGSRYRWASGTSDVRALQSPDQGTRNAATYYDPNQLQVQLTLGTAYTGSLELYAVDWDSTARRETITVTTGQSTQTATLATSFNQGAWITFQLSGATTVTITATRNAGANAVLSGIFLGTGNPPSYPSAPQGNWVGNYGGSGYALAAFNGSSDAALIPGGSVSLTQGSRYLWASGTADVRALQSADQSTRNAATYYDPNQLQVQLNLGTAYTGSLELYAVDWDSTARRETITVTTGQSTQTATLGTNFNQGAWITFQLSGATTINITATRNAGANAVLSGIFLGTGNPPQPTYTVVAVGDIACPSTDMSNYCLQRLTASLAQNQHPDDVLVLGDNQYDHGALSEFESQGAYNATWGVFNSIVHPVPGNHEYDTAGAAGYFQYFGQSIANPANTPNGYYSFNLGNWHLIALNSDCSDSGGCVDGDGATTSAQNSWLQSDLAANKSSCVLAYWHHPLFSSGFGANNPGVGPLWNALYGAHADLVLNGHDHVYERFAQQDPSGTAASNGIREFVVGTGGESLFSVNPSYPNLQASDANDFGVLVLTLHSSSYDYKFIAAGGGQPGFVPAGTVIDSGTGVPCHGSGGGTASVLPARDLSSAQFRRLSGPPLVFDARPLRSSLATLERQGLRVAIHTSRLVDVTVTVSLHRGGRLHRIASFYETESEIPRPYSQILLRLSDRQLKSLRRATLVLRFAVVDSALHHRLVTRIVTLGR